MFKDSGSYDAAMAYLERTGQVWYNDKRYTISDRDKDILSIGEDNVIDLGYKYDKNGNRIVRKK